MSVDTLRRIDPQRAVGSHERVDLPASQLDSLIAQLIQRSKGIVQEFETILLIGDQAADD